MRPYEWILGESQIIITCDRAACSKRTSAVDSVGLSEVETQPNGVAHLN
ncbi:MAG: hypothetical protein RIG63_12130 [Coleofasciculus chthonoplastes F3-SA18-01]|jgi:hypothetical protein